MHVHPPDRDAMLPVDQVAEIARQAGLEFVVLTPHMYPWHWEDRGRRARWLAAYETVATQARATEGITLIPGVEYTVINYGHFGVSGVDAAALRGDDFLDAADAAGAFVVVNHPFAVPTKLPGVPVSERDLSFKPWTEGRGAVPPAVDGVEVWNVPLGVANLFSAPGGKTGEQSAWIEADARARATRRPMVAVGGTDNHLNSITPTTWVLAADASEASILGALRSGAVCVGGPEAGGLEARGAGDQAWVPIGGVAHGDRVELRWPGRAQLFVDGVDRGEHDGGFVDDAAAGVHTYRIVVGESRCGFVYANL
jgi:hypothetical protein